MLALIRQLQQRYRHESHHVAEGAQIPQHLKKTLSALRLAEAALLKQRLNENAPKHPRQIAVIGPTQAGKSTLVNLLGAGQSAGVSALAGYTVHAHAYTVEIDPADTDWAETLFEGFSRVEPTALDAHDYQQYTIQACDGSPLHQLAPCVLWDTPDFDSVSAYGYSSAVLRSLALADVLILALSREKYADKSVWDLLQLIQPLQKPLVVCLNKLDPGTEDALANAFLERYAQLPEPSVTPEIIGIPYIKALSADGQELPSTVLDALTHQLRALVQGVDRQETHTAYAFIQAHWQPWVGPITERHRARERWNTLIADALREAEAQYKRDYLNHPDHYDSFKRALAQLLILLEIPGVAQSLVKVRQAITWPTRKLLNFGRQYVGKGPQSPGSDAQQTDIEQAVLANVCNHLLTVLITRADEHSQSDAPSAGWWSALANTLIERRDAIAQGFATQVEEHQAKFAQTIDQAANDLYKNLEQQPATLNSLRAARVTADAAAVGLALKTGGIGVNDFLLAPAMLSVTSLLTESALGRYIDRVKARLRVDQLDAVTAQLFQGYLAQALHDMAEQSTPADAPSINEQSLTEAEKELERHRAE